MNQRQKKTTQWITSVVFSTIFVMTFAVTSGEDHYSISQISPKSIDYNYDHENIQPSIAVDFAGDDREVDSEIVNHHHRVERSALPILNDGSTLKKLHDVNSNDLVSPVRHFNAIDPTRVDSQKDRMGKSVHGEDSFLGERGRQAKSSRPQETTTNSVMQKEAIAAIQPSNPRQNNGNINDIITGIVKLLNGNVNVHANTGGNRPHSNRINNRGPPRISEAQVPPGENNNNEPSKNSHQQPPFPFERPDGPLRPFLTGVPLPEQIVPSMQQNYNRPGFVSQNRPPWKRPKPRPPINANRRPIPPYKNPPPIPALPEYINTKIEEDQLFNQSNFDEVIDKQQQQNETDNVLDLEDEDIEVDGETEKPTNEYNNNQIVPNRQQITPSITTIIQTTSEVNTIQNYESNEKPEKDDSGNDDDEEDDVIGSSMTETTTNKIDSTSRTPDLIESSKIDAAIATIITSQIPTTSQPASNLRPTQFVARPGLVLDDPEFKPGHKSNINSNYNSRNPIITDGRPPGYGEIFDITLSAIQGPNGNTGSQQTIKIGPYGQYEGTDVIVSPSGDQAFVSIDGKRSYINLFGDSSTTQPIASTSVAPTKPQIKPTNVVTPGITGSGYVVAETEPTIKKASPPHYPQNQNRPVIQRPRYPPQQQQVRIDTCIVGDDSTCDQAQERCKMENGISSCNCRPGYSRRKHRETCRKVVSIVVSVRVDKIYDKKVAWDRQLANQNSEPYKQLSYEAVKAIDSAMSMTPFSDEFMEGKVNNIYQGDPAQGMAGVFVNLTLMIDENKETLNPALKNDIQRHLLGVILRRNNNIGSSALYVESPPGSISAVQDLDECTSADLNDCHSEASCTNTWGSFRCECNTGFRDLFADQPNRAGRECLTCSDSFCNNRGSCSFNAAGNQVCACKGSYYGSTCEIDGEVLFVAIGASVAAIIIIILTLICLIMWSRKWQREHKNAMIGSPVFGYLGGAQVKTPTMGTAPYQVTLEDRMRWAQIADVMAQSNHNIYAAEPTRPSSAIFHAYPTLQTISGMHTLGAMSMGGMTMRTQATLPPVPLPRLGLSRPSGMRTLENSSSSEEEDRTDLLGRGFHVPRPKSRSNASVNSGIYYDVDYLPSGEQNLYGTSNGIQMSTYTPSTTYYK